MSLEIDTILRKAVDGGLPGAVAIATDRDGTIYQGAAGVRRLGADTAMTPDTVMAIFSTTKAITGTAALCLVDDGLLDLDAPAREYVPSIAELHVLEGFDDGGAPITRAPKRDITTRHLLTHTAGLAYELFNATYCQMADSGHIGDLLSAKRDCLMTPLLFDPGERWEYGSNLDWTGQVVEAITGKRLGEVMAARIFEPLGMNNTAFSMTPAMRADMASLHQRDTTGEIAAIDLELPPDPEVHMGGHGLYGTLSDYIHFIRMWLNDGAAPGGHRILSAETVHMAAQNQIGDIEVTPLPAGRPQLTNHADLAPGIETSWGLSFMINNADMATGRPAGSLAWAGLSNVYFWIDRSSGLGGIWATQLFPFADTESLASFAEFETAVYDNAA